MEKEYLDKLYEQRAEWQERIDRLVKESKQPTHQCCDNMSNKNVASEKLNVARCGIHTVNKLIEHYLKIHVK